MLFFLKKLCFCRKKGIFAYNFRGISVIKPKNFEYCDY